MKERESLVEAEKRMESRRIGGGGEEMQRASKEAESRLQLFCVEADPCPCPWLLVAWAKKMERFRAWSIIGDPLIHESQGEDEGVLEVHAWTEHASTRTTRHATDSLPVTTREK